MLVIAKSHKSPEKKTQLKTSYSKNRKANSRGEYFKHVELWQQVFRKMQAKRRLPQFCEGGHKVRSISQTCAKNIRRRWSLRPGSDLIS